MPTWMSKGLEIVKELDAWRQLTGFRYLGGFLTIVIAGLAAKMDNASACGIAITMLTAWRNLLDTGHKTEGSVPIKVTDKTKTN